MSSIVHGQNANTSGISPAFVSDNALHVAQYVWDSSTLSWIKQITEGGGGSGSSEVVVTNFPSTSTVNDGGGSLTVDGFVTTSPISLVKLFDNVSDTLAYVGEASPGSSLSSSVWRIKKLIFDVDGSITTQFADGDSDFNNIWDNRGLLTYV